MGRGQVVKAPGFDPGIRRFESSRPSHVSISVKENLMEQKTLTVKRRVAGGKGPARRLRQAGNIPAVIYGHRDPVVISIDEREFHREFKTVSESTIITIHVDGDDYDVLIKDYTENLVTGKITHIDFYEIERGKILRTHVGVHITGVSPGVRTGGILEQPLHEIEVECLPKDIPQGIDVDISTLDIGDSIHVGDLEVPPDVKYLTNPDQVVVLVAHQRAEVEEVEEGEEEEAALEEGGTEADEEPEESKE